MPKLTGTATEFVLNTLRQHADRECSIADLHAHCEGRFSKDNLHNACKRLHDRGLLVKQVDGERSVFWAIVRAQR
jgi:hypothetical protein